jgi:hypothetical protein
MAIAYRIKDFAAHFLKGDMGRQGERAPKGPPPWVAIPTRHDGKSFRYLGRHAVGTATFGAFVLMVEVAAKMPIRGILADEDGPLDAEDLSLKTGHPAEAFETAFKVLQEPKIGWIDTVDYAEITGKIRETLDKSTYSTAQHTTPHNTTAQGATGEPVAVAAAEFASRGIDAETATWASGQFPPDRIRTAFAAYDAKAAKETIDNPAGLLRTLLVKGCTRPKPRQTRGYTQATAGSTNHISAVIPSLPANADEVIAKGEAFLARRKPKTEAP